MGIVIDIILISILALSIFLGYKKGLVKVAVKLFAVLISIIVTLILYKPVSTIIINNTDIDEKIEQIIIENGTKEIEESTNQEQESGFIKYIEQYTKYAENAVVETQNDIVESAAGVISEKVINIVVIIGLFIITRLVLILLTLVSDLITKLPIIKQFNKLGGLIYGTLRGLLLIYVLLAIAFFIVSMTANNEIINIINNSIITKFMYSNNLLLNIIF